MRFYQITKWWRCWNVSIGGKKKIHLYEYMIQLNIHDLKIRKWVHESGMNKQPNYTNGIDMEHTYGILIYYIQQMFVIPLYILLWWFIRMFLCDEARAHITYLRIWWYGGTEFNKELLLEWM